MSKFICTPWSLYRLKARQGVIHYDHLNVPAVFQINRFFKRAQQRRWHIPHWLIDKRLPRHLYLHGQVGIGKTMMMDLLETCLPANRIHRIHYHALMKTVHELMQLQAHQTDSLVKVAKMVAPGGCVLALDEFIVDDITNAMMLNTLIRTWHRMGVMVITTGNTEPDKLYEGGLQRERFLPTIDFINKKFTVIHCHANRDYRSQQHDITAYTTPENNESLDRFRAIVSQDSAPSDQSITINQRNISVVAHGKRVLWCEFDRLFREPLCYADYLIMAKQFDVFLISGLNPIGARQHNVVTRWIDFIDVLYDEGKTLQLSGSCPLEQLYQRGKLMKPYQRCLSRMMALLHQP